jgi:hypothetical protein
MLTNKIYNLERDPDNGFVVKVTWGIELHDNGLMDRHLSQVEFIQEANSFIPYEQLTEEIVWGWVESRVGHVALAQIEDRLVSRYNAMKQEQSNAPIEGLPW